VRRLRQEAVAVAERATLIKQAVEEDGAVGRWMDELFEEGAGQMSQAAFVRLLGMIGDEYGLDRVQVRGLAQQEPTAMAGVGGCSSGGHEAGRIVEPVGRPV